jgi:hypothetical protein
MHASFLHFISILGNTLQKIEQSFYPIKCGVIGNILGNTLRTLREKVKNALRTGQDHIGNLM